MLVDTVRVEGLSRLNRALRGLNSELPKGLRLAANEAAGIVVDAARAKVSSRTGTAARSIRAASTRTASRVTAGGKRAPYLPWLDYGGRVGPNRSVRRPFISSGRYVYPAYHDNKEEFQRILEQALQRVVTGAGLDM